MLIYTLLMTFLWPQDPEVFMEIPFHISRWSGAGPGLYAFCI